MEVVPALLGEISGDGVSVLGLEALLDSALVVFGTIEQSSRSKSGIFLVGFAFIAFIIGLSPVWFSLVPQGYAAASSSGI